MSYIDATGLSIPTQSDVESTAKERLIAKLNGVLRDDPDGPAYRICVKMLSEAKSETLASIQDVVAGLMPGTSSGEFLTELMRFNGIDRNESEYTTVTLQVTANAGAMNEAADVAIAATVSGDEYVITEPVVLTPLASGTFSARSVTKGAFIALAGDISEISTPLYGWGSVTNLVDASPGRSTETDPAARRRRWRAARGVGMHHESAIKRALEDLDGVEAVVVDANATNATSPEGVPSGAVRAIVWGGGSQEIADTLFGVGTAQNVKGSGSVGAGIGTHGTTTVSVTDAAAGQSGTVYYTQGSDIPIYIDVRTRKGTEYPSDGDELIKSAIAAFFAGDLVIEVEGVETIVDPYEPGEDVASSRIYTAANVVQGHNIQAIYIGTSDPPTSAADVALLLTERAVTSALLITVTGV